MKQTKAPVTTPSPTREVNTSKLDNPTSVFVGMALDMSWRLAIVVLLPIIGGFKFDERLHMTPLLTITGFLLAMVGTGLIMWQTLRSASDVTLPKKEKHV